MILPSKLWLRRYTVEQWVIASGIDPTYARLREIEEAVWRRDILSAWAILPPGRALCKHGASDHAPPMKHAA